MENRFFSLMIIPDSGNDVRTGQLNLKIIIGLLSFLVVTFLTCLFFIIGYHIKLSQEKDYKNSISTSKHLIDNINKAEKKYLDMTGRLAVLQYNDGWFRRSENMKVIDESMYKAGVGGHLIVNDEKLGILDDNLQSELRSIAFGLVTLNHGGEVLDKSMRDILTVVERHHEEYNNTPTSFPTNSIRFTSGYGWRTHPISSIRHFHRAVDIGGYLNQEIYATADGVVELIGWQGPLGRCIKIKHKFGYETLYGHLNSILIKDGDVVKKNDLIGRMGRTGNATGVHLHYAIFLNGRDQNPLAYFRK